jgi:hypothetical protein
MPTAATVSDVNKPLKHYPAFQKSLQTLGPTSLLFSGYRRSFLGVQRHRHAINRSFRSSVGVKNKWKYTSALYIDLRGADGENCTFCSTLQSLQIVNKGSNNKIRQNYSFFLLTQGAYSFCKGNLATCRKVHNKHDSHCACASYQTNTDAV